ncbi:hypothetical protein ACWDY4_30980 [Streptomyces olivaceoviridis]
MEETFRSFAPGGVPVPGSGFGALTAITLKAKFPHSAGRLVLVDTLPGAPSPGQLAVPQGTTGQPHGTPLPRPDDFGRLELERFGLVSSVPVNTWRASGRMGRGVWERAGGTVEEYLRVFGRPGQRAARHEYRPYVADVTA